MESTSGRQERKRFQVVIAGGGVAAMEAFLALGEYARELTHATILAPNEAFEYTPLSVLEPFNMASTRRYDLAEVAFERGGGYRRGALAAVDDERRALVTTDGQEMSYDALIVAVGARPKAAIEGAFRFDGHRHAESYRTLLHALERGEHSSLAFVVPRDAWWPLGMYDLALATASHLAERAQSSPELMLVTFEDEPLSLFGAEASSVVAALLDEAGVRLEAGRAPTRFADGRLDLEGGEAVSCDRAVSLAVPEVPEIEGLPAVGARRFIPTDEFGRVSGLERVWAAGDATTYPVKQGGLAAQQADAAAGSIAALAGAAIDPKPFHPILRGALLTPSGPRYMRRDLEDETSPGVVARSILWWPPSKIAGRFLAPHLAARQSERRSQGALRDVERPALDDPGPGDHGHREAVELALGEADAHAERRDFRGALRWLEVVEDLELTIPPDYAPKRIAWQELAR